MSGTAGTQGECRAEKETEEEIIQRCISHLDTDYSCRLAKQMEREKTNPVLGFRTKRRILAGFVDFRAGSPAV